MEPKTFSDEQLQGFVPLIVGLQNMKLPVSAAPTYTPQNLLEQFVIYKNGSTYRLYVWVDKATGWHYTALT